MKRSLPRPLLITLAAAVLLIGGYMLFFHGNGTGGPGGPGGPGGFPTNVEVAQVGAEPLTISIETVGSLRADESVVIRSEIAGRVEDIFFQEGEHVNKGEPLIAIDSSIYRAELMQAEAQLKLAEQNLKRAVELTERKVKSVSSLDQARADLGVAKAQYELAKAKLDKARILAPFDGTVGLRLVSPGEYVETGQSIVNFSSNDPMKVDFNLPETAIRSVRTGQTLDIRVEAFPDRTFNGTVYAIDPLIEVQGRSIALRAKIPNPDAMLKPGFFARVQLNVENRENALMIPESAIIPQGNDSFVYVVTEEKKAHLAPVKVGIRNKGKVEITEGLKAGQLVVTAGQIKLHEGSMLAFQDPNALAPEEKAP